MTILQKKRTSLIGIALVVSFAGTSVVPALAQTSTPSSSWEAVSAARVAQAKSKANLEIDRRVTGLTKLIVRIQEMKKINDSEKSSLTGIVQNEINSLNSLKAKIAADTDVAALKADVQSITKSYRIYALVIPQATIMAAADRILGTVSSTNELVIKIQARITEAQTAGTDVSSLQATLADLTAKLADANTQAQTAITQVSGLVPDEGDQAKFDANKQVLKDAREKIRTAHQDLQTARKDAGTIVKAIRGFKKPSPATTTP